MIAESMAKYGEQLTAMQPAAASHSAWVSTHQANTSLDGERIKQGVFEAAS